MLSAISKFTICVAAAGIAVGVTGCGHGAAARPPSPPSAVSLFSDFRTSFGRAQSVRVTGHFRYHGHNVTLDVSAFWSGAMKGAIEEGGLKAELLSAGGRTYLYIDKALINYESRLHNIPASACALVCGKFIRVPDMLYSAFSLKRLNRVLAKLGPPISTRANKSGKKPPAPRVRLTTFDGQPAWELSADGIAVFIARNSASYVLGMVNRKSGVVRFSEWNAIPPIRAPRADQVIRLG